MDDATDTRAAEAVREAGLDRAHEALRAQSRAEAEMLASILEVVRNAIAHPQIEVDPAIVGDKAADRAERSAILGLSLELAMSQDQIRSRLAEARTLDSLLPATWAAFRAGSISGPKARTILEAFGRVPVEEELQLYFDSELARLAPTLTNAKLRDHASRLADQLADHPLEVEHELAAKRRRLWLEHEQGTGMSYLTAYLPTDQAVMAKIRLDTIVDTLDDARTTDQKRLDVFADVLTGTGLDSEVRPQVNVYVPLLNLAHCPDELKPATIDGQIPISPKRARELDHQLDWARGGETDVTNLTPKCRSDHTLKHETRWKVRPGHAGKEVWTSPGGRKYWDHTTDPPDAPAWDPAPFDLPACDPFCPEQNDENPVEPAA